jgi:hypothetical protein
MTKRSSILSYNRSLSSTELFKHAFLRWTSAQDSYLLFLIIYNKTEVLFSHSYRVELYLG